MGSKNSKAKSNKQKIQTIQRPIEPTPSAVIPQQNKVINVYFRDNPFNQNHITSEDFTKKENQNELKSRLENEFDRHDAGLKGFLDKAEVKKVLEGVIYIGKLDSRNSNFNEIIKECLNEVEAKENGKVFKDDFVSGKFLKLLIRQSCLPCILPYNLILGTIPKTE